MSDDLPYKAEYAKSGRASCKLCKTPITQDSLRLAKMMQSPHFDGKIPHWFHIACFFRKVKKGTSTDIAGFDALRWDDQQTIKGKLSGEASASAGGDEVDAKGMVNDFLVEYAKSGRATCKGCEEKIVKAKIRIGKLVDGKYGTHPAWYHVNCFAENKSELDAERLSSSEIDGFMKLKAEDQKTIKTSIGLDTSSIGPDTSSKSKKKSKSEKLAKPETKKAPEISKEEIALKKQSELIWKIRDELRRHCSLVEMREMLEDNNQSSQGGENDLLDKCADGIAFGALDNCPECNNGHLVHKSDGYTCTGHLTAWTKCLHITKEPTRKPWLISDELKEDNESLTKFKCKKRVRIFPKLDESAVKSQMETVKSESGKPLADKKIVLVGKLKQSKVDITKKVEQLGGTVIEKVSNNSFCCLSSPAEVGKCGTKMSQVEACNVAVVSEEYLDAIKNGGAMLMIPQYAIAPWGGKAPASKNDTTDAPPVGTKRKNKSEGGEGKATKKAKMTVKGGAVVDPDSGLEDKAHVYKRAGEIYNAVLGLVDLNKGTNSYYKLQLLQHDKKKKWYIFRSWGRVGTSIGGNKTEDFRSADDAVSAFVQLFGEKTGNDWYDRKNFAKCPYKFYPLDIDYGQDDETVKSLVISGSQSKLPKPVQDLVRMIFDVESMKKTMIEFEIDLKKMPLGKLSKRQIDNAYAVLGELQKHIIDQASTTKFLDASNRFYTLIPHDFGMKKPQMLNSEELIKAKIDMLDSLMDIEIAYSLLKGTEGSTRDPIDVHYESLKTDLQVLDSKTDEFSLLEKYVKNTHAATHAMYTLEVLEVFKVDREGEAARFKPFKELHNRQLLWHGSRTTNYAGIISQGLRIAPPEAPVTGYMFGKGLYFADMVSKSANYCRTTQSNNIAFMLLCETALGNMYELTAAKCITKLPSGKHSCKGCGKTGPDPMQQHTTDDGVVIPLGPAVSTLPLTNNSTLLYNEYIVYDVAQVNIKYMLKMKFNYKGW